MMTELRDSPSRRVRLVEANDAPSTSWDVVMVETGDVSEATYVGYCANKAAITTVESMDPRGAECPRCFEVHPAEWTA